MAKVSQPDSGAPGSGDTLAPVPSPPFTASQGPALSLPPPEGRAFGGLACPHAERLRGPHPEEAVMS